MALLIKQKTRPKYGRENRLTVTECRDEVKLLCWPHPFLPETKERQMKYKWDIHKLESSS